MIRTFLLSTKRLLQPRPLQGQTRISESPVLESAALYDVRRSRHANSHDTHQLIQPIRPRPLLDLTPGIGHLPTPNSIRWAATHSQLSYHLPSALVQYRGSSLLPTGRSGLLDTYSVRWSATSANKKQFQMPDPALIVCNMLKMLKCVNLQHMKEAPEPAFWTALAIGGSQIFLPFLEVVGGYSPVLTMLQLHMAAVGLGFSGGTRWGLGISSNPEPTPTWDTMRSALLPPAIAVTGLLLPYPLGFLTVASGMVTSLYLDLKSCAYPPWALAASLFITLSTVVGLLLALSAYVLFSNGKSKKKNGNGKAKDAPPPKNKEEEYDGVDGSEEENVKKDGGK